MNSKLILDLLVWRTWWTYPTGRREWFDSPYHFFNLFEGTVWVILSILVLARCVRSRRSLMEVAYALAFFSFGLTDFREAYALNTWLIWVKAANLLALIGLRAVVIKRYYPASRLY